MIQKKTCIFLLLHFDVFMQLNWFVWTVFCCCYHYYYWRFIVHCINKTYISKSQIICRVCDFFPHQFRFRLIFILCLIYRVVVIIFRRLLFCIYVLSLYLCHTQQQQQQQRTICTWFECRNNSNQTLFKKMKKKTKESWRDREREMVVGRWWPSCAGGKTLKKKGRARERK